MTLDDLIDRLQQLRRACPAAATATVIGFGLDRIEYARGEVQIGDYDPDDCELIEVEVKPIAPPLPRMGAVH
jgi:hypothetical protein